MLPMLMIVLMGQVIAVMLKVMVLMMMATVTLIMSKMMS